MHRLTAYSLVFLYYASTPSFILLLTSLTCLSQKDPFLITSSMHLSLLGSRNIISQKKTFPAIVQFPTSTSYPRSSNTSPTLAFSTISIPSHQSLHFNPPTATITPPKLPYSAFKTISSLLPISKNFQLSYC